MLLRVKLRETSWEEGDLATIVKAEFPGRDRPGPDLTPSVYLLSERTHTTRAVSEHYASCKIERPPSRTHVDIDGLGGSAQPAETDAPFSFIRVAHHEMRLASVQALEALVARLRADLARRSIRITSDEIKDYVAERLRERDAEWCSFCETAANGPKWRKYEKRPRPTQASSVAVAVATPAAILNQAPIRGGQDAAAGPVEAAPSPASLSALLKGKLSALAAWIRSFISA
jgi:hypothetical protein